MISMKKALTAGAIAAACMAGSAANASITYQGVTFTTTFSGNTLYVEIDAANPTGDWSTATTIGALQVKDVGTFTGVTMTGPGAASSWTISNQELEANGCLGGSLGNMRACASGTHVPLTDNMVFAYTFTGTVDLTNPQLKVNFFNGDNPDKVGSLLSMNVPAQPVPEPGTYAMLLGGLGVLGLARRRAAKAA